MYILGINAYHADSSAALLKNGELIVATEEERFTRIKHWAGFPTQAIQFCLNEEGITVNDLEFITIGRNPDAKIFSKAKFLISNPQLGISILKNRFQNRTLISSLAEEIRKIDSTASLNEISTKLEYIEHHRSHLASAFFASPFKEAAIISIDGSGDFTTSMIARGTENKITVIDSVDFPCSLGLFYTAFTQFLGFYNYGDEYKVMGLAPYGNPVYVDKLHKIISLKENGLFDWDSSYFKLTNKGGLSYKENIPVVPELFSIKFVEDFGSPRRNDEKITQHHKDLASSVQKITEEVIIHIASHLQTKTGSKNLCIAGGVAQNSVANGKILKSTKFENLYIPSAGHDAGISMGSALYFYNHVLEKPRVNPVYNAYTGSRFNNKDIEKILNSTNLNYTFYPDEELIDNVSRYLIEGNVVGWFHGRAEFGPRALGSRSILVDPRRSDAKELLNEKIKRRESFRPFAPSILEEFVGDFFDYADKVPFMEKVYPIKKEKQSLIPAVTHVDGTGRLQTVSKGTRYYDLINSFYEKSGIPVLLNTSFNENEPIVNTPGEAIDCFNRTNMDILVLENFIVKRKQ